MERIASSLSLKPQPQTNDEGHHHVIRRKSVLHGWVSYQEALSEVEQSPLIDSANFLHDWELYSFSKPTFCQRCDKVNNNHMTLTNEFIFGLSKQGYRCRACKYAAHTRCKQLMHDSLEPCLVRHKESNRGSLLPSESSPNDTPNASRRNTLRRQKKHPLHENTVRVILVSESEEVAVALADEFTNEFFPEVSVEKGDLFEHNFDCVIANGSSFGLLAGSRLIRYFGEDIKKRIINQIVDVHHGELGVGQCFLIETGNEKVPYVAHTALRRTRGTPHIDPYMGFRASLLEIEKHNKRCQELYQPEKMIRTVAFHFSVWTYHEYSFNELARRIHLSYKNFKNPFAIIENDSFLIEQEELLKPLPPKTEEQTEREFLDFLTDGTIAQRGYVNNWQFDYLLFLIETEEYPHLRLTAAQVIAALLCDKSVKKYVRQKVANQVLAQLIDFASQGLIEVHSNIEPSEVEEQDIVGKGGEATVLRGTFKGRSVAVKKFHEGALDFRGEDIRKEIALMSLLSHENLVEFLGGKLTNSTLYIVTALLECDLAHFLENQSEALPWPLLLKMAIDAASGMEFLHSVKVVHRDLKSKNLLVDRHQNVLVCDYGVSKIVSEHKTGEDGPIGTPSYMAPEIYNREPFTEKADVFSFGIVLWELLTRETPYKDIEVFTIPNMVTKGERPPIPKSCPAAYQKLMKSCWAAAPKSRPDFSQILVELRRMVSNQDTLLGPTIGNRRGSLVGPRPVF